MARAVLDHLVVAASTVAAGNAYVQRLLGVIPQSGGRHLLMGTHNSLLNLSSGSCGKEGNPIGSKTPLPLLHLFFPFPS